MRHPGYRTGWATPLLAAALITAVSVGVTGCQSDRGPSGSGGARPSSSTSSNEHDAVRFAEAAWQAFYGNANAGMDYDEWWSQLRPLLTPGAEEVHVYDDPRTFEDVTVTGELSEAPVPPDVPGVTAEVYVPTDLGQFSLFLSRTTETSPWRLEGIGFPEGVGS